MGRQWNESDHPRHADGKFARKGSGWASLLIAVLILGGLSSYGDDDTTDSGNAENQAIAAGLGATSSTVPM